MLKCMIGVIAVALFICISATPAAAHGFLMINTGNSLLDGGGLIDLSDSTSFFFSATFESGTGVDDSWEILGGLRFYPNAAGFHPYWGLYALSENLNDPIEETALRVHTAGSGDTARFFRSALLPRPE